MAVTSLLLLSILFEQGNNRDYEHTECKKFHPCNHSISPPLLGCEEASPPDGGVPPTVARQRHCQDTPDSGKSQQRFGAVKNLLSRLTFAFDMGKIVITMCKGGTTMDAGGSGNIPGRSRLGSVAGLTA